jgi:hypothetical protein
MLNGFFTSIHEEKAVAFGRRVLFLPPYSKEIFQNQIAYAGNRD